MLKPNRPARPATYARRLMKEYHNDKTRAATVVENIVSMIPSPRTTEQYERQLPVRQYYDAVLSAIRHA